MKIANPIEGAATAGIKRTAESRPLSRGETRAASAPRSITDTVETLGIPSGELTPSVHKAIVALIGEVDTLRRDLDAANRRLRELEDLADMDTLLPVPNRRAFVRELNRMISFAERYGAPSTVMFIDLNDMKVINDTYGHEAGDKALLHVARTLSDNIRGTDTVARLGGDEFGVILAQADEETGRRKAEDLAALVRQTPLTINGTQHAVNLAYGTYTFRSDDAPETALARADEAMYANKKAIKGENAVR